MGKIVETAKWLVENKVYVDILSYLMVDMHFG